MLKRKSTRQLLAAAYFLISLFPCKCFSHFIAKGRAYVSNPYTADSLNSIYLGDVDITLSWGNDGVLNFFQIDMIDPEFGVPFTLIQNSPALIQALNQAVHFGAAGVDNLNEPLPDFQMPFLFEGWPRFNVLRNQKMGKASSSKCRSAGEFYIRSYWSGKNKLLGVLSANKYLGPLANLVAFSFGNGSLYIKITSEEIDKLEELHSQSDKGTDKLKRFDSDGGDDDGAGSIVEANTLREYNLGYSESLLVGMKYLLLLDLLTLKSKWSFSLF